MAGTGDAAKTIFITGAASGMGRATALLFADKGWRVGAFDIQADGLASLQGEIGEKRCLTQRLDVSDKADYESAVDAFSDWTDGRMDILFNNAGIAFGGWFEDVSYDAAMRIVQVNYIGVLNGIYSALPLLRATPGSLCFTTSSSSATYGAPRLAVYASTKFAVKGLTEALSVEFSRHGIRVADVLPGIIETPMIDTAMEHGQGGDGEALTIRDVASEEGAFRLMPAEAVAECVWQAYGSDRLHWYVPEEVGDIDRAKAAGAEIVRDQMRKTVLGGAASG